MSGRRKTSGELAVSPLAALFLRTTELTLDRFIAIITSVRTLHAFELSFGLSLLAALVNLIFGRLVVCALVCYESPGRRILDAIVDIPFALPMAVAGIDLLNLRLFGFDPELPSTAAQASVSWPRRRLPSRQWP